ncbi:hypothetical protein [uncultured Paludibaculum sp.]|uniref:hypothetical protein n=1 Tax=uncultured Paludibaculum sp. TaxID=1765020 RepID=UPI002AABE254|nr:hypothetical protein [uncultured Paludibaculum sp.]
MQLYPAEWRTEYGEELGALLALRPITPAVLVDVARSAARERLKRDGVWIVCGVSLFIWTVLGICLNNTAPLSHESYGRYKDLWIVLVLLAGCLTAVRRPAASPSWAAAKAALLGLVPEIAALTLWAAGAVHPLVAKAAGPFPLLECRLAVFDMTFPTVPQPGFAVVPFAIVVALLRACGIGFVGGLLGRVISFLSPRLRLR